LSWVKFFYPETGKLTKVKTVLRKDDLRKRLMRVNCDISHKEGSGRKD